MTSSALPPLAPPRSPARRSGPVGRVLVAAGVLALASCGPAVRARETAPGSPRAPFGPVGVARPGARPLPVTVHTMSLCPYSIEALRTLVPLARRLGPAVELRLEHIGRAVDGEPTSMHGPDEVAGDVAQLCARRHGPYERWLAFLECHVAGEDGGQAEGLAGWEPCAERSGLDPEPIRACIEGQEGRALVLESFRRSDEAGMRGSPTFVFGPDRYNGGRSEDSFARAICDLLEEPRPRHCANLPPPHRVSVVLLTDRRCVEPECDVETALAPIRELVPGAEVRRLDYADELGRALHRQLGLGLLPALLVSTAVEEVDGGRRAVSGHDLVGDYYVRTLGRFDPARGVWVPRPEVPVSLLVDARCTRRECEEVWRFTGLLERRLAGLRLAEVDYLTEEGRRLWEKVAREAPRDAGRGPLGLPLALFGKALAEEPEVFGLLRARLFEVGDRYTYQLGQWDPMAEICDNGLDDDDDGLVDCRDPDCRDALVCRPEKARRLDLFVMSRCPFAAQVLEEVVPFLEGLGRSRAKADLRVQFIGLAREGGELASLHGEAEVEEDLRWACAQHLDPRGYRFVDFVACRARDRGEDGWERCVPEGLDGRAIRACAEGPLGRRLVAESFELARALGITASPSWLLNNRWPMQARTRREMLDAFCEHNALPECAAVPEIIEQGPARTPAGSCR